MIDLSKEKILFKGTMGANSIKSLDFSQRNFVIMELTNRLIILGHKPSQISISSHLMFDIILSFQNEICIGIDCNRWEDEYGEKINQVLRDKKKYKEMATQFSLTHFCAYSSRLKAGLIESKSTAFPLDYLSNINDNDENMLSSIECVGRNEAVPNEHPTVQVVMPNNDVFDILNGELISYYGKHKDVKLPQNVQKLGNGAFLGHSTIKTVMASDNLVNLGGDTFYDCINLVSFTIPPDVKIMGDNPFANCPKLELKNNSRYFVIEEGALYDGEKTRLIYYPINSENSDFIIPDNVISISKHAFYNCVNIRKITIPPSVMIIENNPFSNLPELQLINKSPHFVLIKGALYNCIYSTLFYYEIGNPQEKLKLKEGTVIIGRHSFFNCTNLHQLVIPSTVELIGYNPFAGCLNLKLINESPNFCYKDGTLFDQKMQQVMFHSNTILNENVTLPDSVIKIDRSSFYKCSNLSSIIIPEGVLRIERSAFAYCTNLEKVSMPSTIEFIDKWAFINCDSLKKLLLPKGVCYDPKSFDSHIKIRMR